MMQSPAVPSIFDAFNARALDPQQVAQTFVPSAHYSVLVKQAHTLIVGPRGSGKTTLLKMLQQPALEAWSHPDADNFRRSINFTGVFIATDVSWREQISALGNLQLEPEYARILSIAAFSTHVLRALVMSMEQRVAKAAASSGVPQHRRVEITVEGESQLVREVSRNWHLRPTLPTLLSLRYSLSSRLSEIYELGSRETLLPKEGRGERLASVPYLHLDFLKSATLAIEIFDDATSQGRGRWALLFDELELAPEWILSKLVNSLRSVDDRFLFKLSMSPFSRDVTGFESALSATPGHDYDVIPLWYAHKEEGYTFCRALLTSMIRARGNSTVEPEQLLGRSEFETPVEEWAETGTAYRRGSRLQVRFARMAQRDKSFRDYLASRQIDPESLDVPEGDARAADIRKVTSLLVVRDAFRSDDSTEAAALHRRLRTRKNPPLYAGAKAVFAMSEGNPRWLKGIVGRLLTEAPHTGRITAARQNAEVREAAHRFRALLRTIPCPPLPSNRTVRGLLSVLDLIGRHFFNAVVLDDFNPDPSGSFIIDSRTDPILVESLGRALNAGAIIYVPDNSSPLTLGSLRGKRFRLSYLLAPYYQLPLMLGKPVALSSILKSEPAGNLFGLEGESDE
jgi:hypothetical protein